MIMWFNFADLHQVIDTHDRYGPRRDPRDGVSADWEYRVPRTRLANRANRVSRTDRANRVSRVKRPGHSTRLLRSTGVRMMRLADRLESF